MNVREALEKLAFDDEDIEDLAPIIEKALRAAYGAGFEDGMLALHDNSEDGVTAGVAAMMEES